MTLLLFLFAILLLSMLAHEMGHGLAASAFGLPWRLELGWYGIRVRIRGRYRRLENAVVALGGPMASLLTAGLLLRGAWHPVAVLNLILALWNLLPVAGSDGANLLRAVRGEW